MSANTRIILWCGLSLFLLGCASRPETLEQVIQQSQQRYVRVSAGPERYECFTDEDLVAFKEKNIAHKIEQELSRSRDFIRIVQALKARPEAERQTTLAAARRQYQPLWEELGRIAPEGQTRAGQEAQWMICTAIVGLAEKLLTLSDENLQKMTGQ